MSLRKYIETAIFTAILFISGSSVAQASNVPNFPTCSNPQGTLIASYNEGIHGIPGSTSEYRGSDQVYFVNDQSVLQCFCAENGSGIQSNWWKIDGLSQQEIDNYKSSGWIYIPDGSEWGLSSGAYLVNNLSYSCKPTPVVQSRSTSPAGPPVCTATRPDAPIITSIQRNGTKATINWTKVDRATHYMLMYGPVGGNLDYGVPNVGNTVSFTVEKLNPSIKYNFVVYAVNDCMPSEPSGIGGYTSGSILGWASTGNVRLIYLLGISGVSFIIIGRLLRDKKEY